MINFQLLFLALFFSLGSFAQTVTNVYWKNKAEDGSGIINYKTSTGLKWSDFTGKPNPAGRQAALTSSGFGYDFDMSRTGSEVTINVAVYCFFIKKESWVKPGMSTSYILNHEQRHFDITYLAANMFYEKIRSLSLNRSNVESLISQAYAEANEWLRNTQNEYDKQTLHSTVPEQQTAWDEQIVRKLNLVSNSR